MKRLKRLTLLLLVISILFSSITVSPISSLASSTSNNAVTFYAWANTGGRTSSNAYFVVSQNMIKFVTSGSTAPPSYVRYKTIGFQVRARLSSGTVLWTIFPLGSKGFSLLDERTSGSSTYSLWG